MLKNASIYACFVKFCLALNSYEQTIEENLS